MRWGEMNDNERCLETRNRIVWLAVLLWDQHVSLALYWLIAVVRSVGLFDERHRRRRFARLRQARGGDLLRGFKCFAECGDMGGVLCWRTLFYRSCGLEISVLGPSRNRNTWSWPLRCSLTKDGVVFHSHRWVGSEVGLSDAQRCLQFVQRSRTLPLPASRTSPTVPDVQRCFLQAQTPCTGSFVLDL